MVGVKKKDRAYYRYNLDNKPELLSYTTSMLLYEHMMELRNGALAKEIENCNKYVILQILRAVDTRLYYLSVENKKLEDTIKELKGE